MNYTIPANSPHPVFNIIEWNKNKRRNTSALLRVETSKGIKNILIDCGKTFYDAVIHCFTRHQLRNIDAVLLTHPHADAILGLDDLRMWTMHARIQEYIDIYLTPATLERVQGCFPYLISKNEATGSGEVADLRFHVFEQEAECITLFDEVKVIPIPVHHGSLSNGDPLISLGFRVDAMTYISDVHYIPAESMKRIQGTKTLIIDALKHEPHSSHFSYEQAMQACLSILPDDGRGYFTGLCHVASHEQITQWIQNHSLRKKRNLNVQVAFDTLLIPF